MSKFPKFQVWDSVRVTHPGYWFDKVGTVTDRDADGDRCYVVSFPDRAPANFTADELILADEHAHYDDAGLGYASGEASITDSVAALNALAEKFAGDYVEVISHPAHYGGDTTYETIKVIEAWGLGFGIGNCVKYLSRAGKKGAAVEDLKKARFYLDREIARMESTGAP